MYNICILLLCDYELLIVGIVRAKFYESLIAEIRKNNLAFRRVISTTYGKTRVTVLLYSTLAT